MKIGRMLHGNPNLNDPLFHKPKGKLKLEGKLIQNVISVYADLTVVCQQRD